MIDRNVMGMLFFISSEAAFFLMLILTYVNFHKVTGHQAATMLDVTRTAVFSIALLSSSLTMWLAEHSRKRDGKWMGFWLLITVVLGGIFLFGQGIEYAELLHQGLTISRDLFGSTFFTLTGFHGLHVLIGLILLVMLTALAFFGRKGEPAAPGLDAVAVYWHFVDAVWVVIFSVVYLWRYL